MIGSLQGTVIHHQESWLILETSSGVGYKVTIGPRSTAEGQSLRLFTHHHIREDADDLYGFFSVAELLIFELLLSVSGVGPKMAMAIGATIGREAVLEAVASNQPAIFKSVSGVGQKVAEKIVLELKGKIQTMGSFNLAGTQSGELFEALVGLGYHQAEIVQVMKELDPASSTAQKLKQALRLLAR